MNNATDMVFKDISSEESREYTFVTAHGTSYIIIDSPTHLNVSDSGGHRILDAHGVSHYIPTGWIKLEWKAKPGMPNFVA